MGYNDVFKDIIQPIKTSYFCVGDSKVPMQIERIWDGTPLEGTDHVIDSIGVRDNTSKIYRHRLRSFWNRQKARYHYKLRTVFKLFLTRWHTQAESLVQSDRDFENSGPSEVKASIRKPSKAKAVENNPKITLRTNHK